MTVAGTVAGTVSMGVALPMAAVTMAGAVMEGDDDGGSGNRGGCSGNSDDGSRSDVSGSGIILVAVATMRTTIVRWGQQSYLVHMSIINQLLTAKSGGQYVC